MKIASQPDGTRDGTLVVVSRDLTRCVEAANISPTMQHALDYWDDVAPELEALSRSIESGSVAWSRFRERNALAPLPRSYRLLGASAYVNYVSLFRQEDGLEAPQTSWPDPLMHPSASDTFLPARGDIAVQDAAWRVDLEAEVAVIVGDVPAGASHEEASNAILLVMLSNDICFRAFAASELAKGYGFLQSKPCNSFSPVAVTPASLGDLWQDGRLCGTVSVDRNGEPLGRVASGEDMAFDFPALIAHAAVSRSLSAGTIIASGTISNRGPDGGFGQPISGGGRGFACIAEQRLVESIGGDATTPYLDDGDTVRIEMLGSDNRTIFGAIEQRVVVQ